MELTALAFTMLLLLVGLGRLVEMATSRRHQRQLAARGVGLRPEPRFRFMVGLHAATLVSAGLEVWLLGRPFLWPLALAAGLFFVLANLLRWWVIRTMAEHWNVRVMDSVSLSVVSDGPFRWIRHPNYVAVFVELLALPLIHGAWLTALVFGMSHVWVLASRIALEEEVLLAHPAYREAMAHKPRFVPRISQ